jgi:hypothetical protein
MFEAKACAFLLLGWVAIRTPGPALEWRAHRLPLPQKRWEPELAALAVRVWSPAVASNVAVSTSVQSLVYTEQLRTACRTTRVGESF